MLLRFIKVDIEKNQDIAEPRKISSIPTFHFIVGGKLKDEMQGANPTQLESKINQWKVDVNPFGGKGFKLSAESTSGSAPPMVL
jgi:thioredoxin-like negative regulator of GroEL